MLYSHASGLAIRAAFFLALQAPGKLSPVHEIAKGTGLSEPYLAKILRRLTSAGLVRAFRGPGGGIELGRPPEAISLWSIVRAIDGPAQPEFCALGLQACSEQNPCPLHHQWLGLRAQLQRLLDETTLATLTSGLRERMEMGRTPWLRLSAEASRVRSHDSEKRPAS